MIFKNSVGCITRKDIQDQSEQIEQEVNRDQWKLYYKVYDALTFMKHVDKVDFSSKEEQR